MSQEMSEAVQQKIAELLRKTKAKNEEYKKSKREHVEQMKVKEEEKKRQIKEQAKMKESSVKSVAATSTVTTKTDMDC